MVTMKTPYAQVTMHKLWLTRGDISVKIFRGQRQRSFNKWCFFFLCFFGITNITGSIAFQSQSQ